MKAINLIYLAFVLASAEAVSAPSITKAPVPLEKRFKDVIVNPDYKKQQEIKENGGPIEEEEEAPQPWIRTLKNGELTHVTPTVIAGVTFNGKPPKETNGLEKWVSLNKNGAPKTISPKLKNGITEKARPTYGTWFATPTTVLIPKHKVKGADTGEEEHIKDVQYIEEDSSFHELDPLIRCTPDRYFKKGMGKDIPSEPFCTPHDNQKLQMDKTYFISWYSKFFPDVENVRIHLSYVKESLRQKGLKREFNESTEDIIERRSSVMQKGGKLEASLFTSEWVPNIQGFYPLTIDEAWFEPKDFYRKVLISIQPEGVKDEEFEHLDNYVVIEIVKGATVAKGHQEDLKKLDQKYMDQITGKEAEAVDNIDYEKYFIIMSMPTAVAIMGLAMYLFVWVNKSSLDLKHLKKYKFKPSGKKLPFKFKSKSKKYSSLPQYAGESSKSD